MYFKFIHFIVLLKPWCNLKIRKGKFTHRSKMICRDRIYEHDLRIRSTNVPHSPHTPIVWILHDVARFHSSNSSTAHKTRESITITDITNKYHSQMKTTFCTDSLEIIYLLKFSLFKIRYDCIESHDNCNKTQRKVISMISSLSNFVSITSVSSALKLTCRKSISLNASTFILK